MGFELIGLALWFRVINFGGFEFRGLAAVDYSWHKETRAFGWLPRDVV